MKKWGLIVTGFYVLVLLLLLVPVSAPLAGMEFKLDLYKQAPVWLTIAILICGQALLLFLSVDTTWKKLKPRAHLLITVAVTSMLLGLLTFGMLWSLIPAVFGEHGYHWDPLIDSLLKICAWWAILWCIWFVVFYRFVKGRSDVVTRAISWLFRGSVLELLVAVPCHIIVRRRGDCSAPALTSYGITTGIAIMILSFGPSVLLLYKKRMDEYSLPKRRESD